MIIATRLVTSGHAAQSDDVVLPDQIRIDGVEQPLLLNGAGVREKFFVDVYVAALYLPRTQQGVGSLLSNPPANRVMMHFVYREVTKKKLGDAWREGFRNNLTVDAYTALAARLERFIGLFGDMHAGDYVWLDHLPGQGTRVSINGRQVGMIAGTDFNSALLAVWVGKKPVTQALKKAMVGVDKQ